MLNIRLAADEQVSLLDVAGGTGDIAFRLFDGMQKSYQRARIPPHITVCDINPRMLAVGEERAAARGYAGESGVCEGLAPHVVGRRTGVAKTSQTAL